MIYGNATGGFGMPKMIEITDNNGNTFIGTVTDSEVIFDATRDDVKIGKTFASNDGVQEGIDTRTYRTCIKNWLIFPGENYSISLSDYNRYDYTGFNAMIAKFNSTIVDSTAVEKVVLNDCVYNVNSTSILSTITKNQETKSVDFNITNNTDYTYVVYVSTYKEEG